MFTHAHLTTISTLSDSPFTDETHLGWNSPGALMMCAAAQAKQTWNVLHNVPFSTRAQRHVNLLLVMLYLAVIKMIFALTE